MTASGKNRRLTIMRVFWLLYAAALVTATHIPIPDDAIVLVTAYDKLLHGTAFFLLAVFTSIAFLKRESPLTSWVSLCGALLTYAILDEYLQNFVERTPDVADWLCDALGIILGTFVTRLGRRWMFTGMQPARVEQL
ncbi:VanZ family protein [Planctomicrobium piriforme]|uniref:VanZ like family protein n=1 Tax=Planctomicrobium piriforme TaxID=1576369 RepID=A0A1I3RME5_9PLAN|nr:VanZ family protein [Planctomicrobium piriforme]SFJ47495.1 VanZ like family protein [Planctomicrobium piriforme]